jgi:hypothetical protein
MRRQAFFGADGGDGGGIQIQQELARLKFGHGDGFKKE